MNGNRVLLYFENNTQLSDWQDGGGSHLLFDVSIWPNDGTGFPMLDGVALLVGAKTYIQNDGINTNIDTDTNTAATTNPLIRFKKLFENCFCYVF